MVLEILVDISDMFYFAGSGLGEREEASEVGGGGGLLFSLY